MRCIGTYYTHNYECMLYQVSYVKPSWISNLCYFDTYNNGLYSPNLRNLALNARDIEGVQRDEYYWARYVTIPNSLF